MKKVNYILFILLSLIIFTGNVNASTTKSGNYFTCSSATNKCITCTYDKVTYYIKSDGSGSGSVAWEATSDSNYSSAKATDANVSDFCDGDNCSNLKCKSSIYKYPDSQGNVTYTFTEPSSQYKATVNLTDSSDNGKSVISEDTQQQIDNGTKYTPRSCSYYTYTTKQGSSTPTQSSTKNFTVTMDADGNFTITYNGQAVSNASSLANTGNITAKKFSNGCPTIYASCPTTTSSGVICSASTRDIYSGSTDGSADDSTSSTEQEALTDGATESDDFLQICDSTKNPQLVAGFRFVGKLLNIVKIVVPIIIIVMGMIDLSKAVVDGNDSAIKKSLLTFIKRVIIGVLVFLAPTIIFGLYKLVDGWTGISKKYQVCVQCILGQDDCPEVTIVSASK